MRGGKRMSVNVKPIQATPSLSGEDAKRIMLQVSTNPSKEAIKKNEVLLKLRKNILKKWEKNGRKKKFGISKQFRKL